MFVIISTFQFRACFSGDCECKMTVKVASGTLESMHLIDPTVPQLKTYILMSILLIFSRINQLMRQYCEEAAKYGDVIVDDVTVPPKRILVILNPAANKKSAEKPVRTTCFP